MKAEVQVLSAAECAEVHEHSLELLKNTGVRVFSQKGRSLLKQAGGLVNEHTHVIRFPPQLVEDALRVAPRQFRLGGRRPDWDLDMNIGECSLLADGGAVNVLDWETGEIRPGSFQDWLDATHLIDALDEIGIYWNMVESGLGGATYVDFVCYWRNVLEHCSKHAQDSTDDPVKSQLLLEILQIAFGDRDALRQKHPFSFLLCPMSPLTIDAQYTDAYLEIAGWDIPVAIMPMPLMGATGPASIISSVLLANAEFLAMHCLVQAACPGTPVIYAPVTQSVDPHTWRYVGGGVENSLFGAATTALGRFYGLPVEAATGGTDQYYPGAQSGYERAINWAMPSLSWPDILVGPGLLGGSTILCLEQMLMDVEIFRRCARLHEGIRTAPERWLDGVIAETGPGGHFLNKRSTLQALREGRFYLSEFGFHDTYEKWKQAGMPDIVDQIQEVTRQVLRDHQPLPLDPGVTHELEKLERRVRAQDQ
jgi:trimethylamine--corrinoid protein Co-methyltransferase